VNTLEKRFKAPPRDGAGAGGAGGDGITDVITSGGPLPEGEAVIWGLTTMQSILTSDFKASEIEVGIVSHPPGGGGGGAYYTQPTHGPPRAQVGKEGRFRVLTEAEVEAFLGTIAERE